LTDGRAAKYVQKQDERGFFSNMTMLSTASGGIEFHTATVSG